jgi:hypothetical protein
MECTKTDFTKSDHIFNTLMEILHIPIINVSVYLHNMIHKLYTFFHMTGFLFKG